MMTSDSYKSPSSNLVGRDSSLTLMADSNQVPVLVKISEEVEKQLYFSEELTSRLESIVNRFQTVQEEDISEKAPEIAYLPGFINSFNESEIKLRRINRKTERLIKILNSYI